MCVCVLRKKCIDFAGYESPFERLLHCDISQYLPCRKPGENFENIEASFLRPGKNFENIEGSF
jgi:hypothetical protein